MRPPSLNSINTFNWSGEHGHRFRIHGKDYGIAYLGGLNFGDNPHAVRLSRFRLHPRESFRYEYDFIWRVAILLEEIRPYDQRILPVCVGGRAAAPGEEYAGTLAYLQRLDRHRHEFPFEASGKMAEAIRRCLDPGGGRQALGDLAAGKPLWETRVSDASITYIRRTASSTSPSAWAAVARKRRGLRRWTVSTTCIVQIRFRKAGEAHPLKRFIRVLAIGAEIGKPGNPEPGTCAGGIRFPAAVIRVISFRAMQLNQSSYCALSSPIFGAQAILEPALACL